MDILSRIKTAELFDQYGALLTKKQQLIMRQNLIEDIGLSEIAENLNISRQAVLDSIKKSEAQLNLFENTLHFCKKTRAIKSELIKLEKSEDAQNSQKVMRAISAIRKSL